MKTILLVGFGGFIGSSLRYLVQKISLPFFVSPFPYPTFFVNILGSFIIGLIFGLTSKYEILSADVRLFITVGFCGGFTTFSSFSNESFLLIKDGNYFYFFLYTFLSVFVSILFTFLGYLIFKIK